MIMIEFREGTPICSWEIQDASAGRRYLKIPLYDYLALVKVSTSLEHLRTMVFEWESAKRRKAARA